MKKVFLFAYDNVNLGDDLFIHFITHRYPNIKFYFWTDKKNKRVFSNCSNLRVVDEKGWIIRTLNRIRPSFPVRYKYWCEKKCDLSLYVGGSIFIEYPNWINQINWLDYQVRHYKFYVLGANFGPYHEEKYRNQLKLVFDNMEDVCFRDLYSKNKFQDCVKVRYAPDILLSFPMPKVEIKGKQVFISVIDCEGRMELEEYDENYISNMTSFIKKFIQDNCNIVLSSFCAKEGDELAIEKIMNRLEVKEKKKVMVLNYNGLNLSEMLRTIAESDFIVGTRFHSIILSLAANRPCLPIIYSDKTAHILQDLNFKGEIIDLRKNSKWNFYESKENWNDRVKQIDNTMKSMSQLHFEKLDKILE